MEQFSSAGSRDWMEKAECAKEDDPELFWADSSNAKAIRAAKEICGRCVVSAECLEYALENDAVFGIWGGVTEKEQKELKSLRAPSISRRAS